MKLCRILRAARKAHSKLTTLDFASSGTYSVEYQRTKPWREEGPRKVGQFSRITSSKLRSDASQKGGSWAKPPGGLHG